MIFIQNLLKKHKLVIIVISALLTTFALMLLVRLPGMVNSEPKSVTVEEENGVYDLTGISDWEETTVTLPPGPTYYPNALLTPETAESSVPVSTEQYNVLRADYLSQRFEVEMPDNSDVYTLTFLLSGRHAMCVYVNGELVGQSGKPGVTKQDTEVWENKPDLLFLAQRWQDGHSSSVGTVLSLWRRCAAGNP